MNGPVSPEDALREHLSEEKPGSEFKLVRLDLAVDGWTFFDVIAMDVTDAQPTAEVVRDDGTVVTKESEDALGEIYQSMGINESGELPLSDIIHIAIALLAADLRPLIHAVTTERVSRKFDADPHPPQVNRDSDETVISFWADSSGHNASLSLCTLTIYEDYSIEWDRTIVEMME